MVKRKKASDRPLLSRTPSHRGKNAGTDGADNELPFDIDDEVGQHVRERHQQLGSGAATTARLSGSREKKLALEIDDLENFDEDAEEVEPELFEQDVLPVDVSDSDEDDDDDSSADGEDSESEDGDGRPSSMEGKLQQRDWGSRRHVWYGGDTHDYEVMLDEEREVALAEEEEEAITLQKQAVDTLLPQDFIDDNLVLSPDDDSDVGAGAERKSSKSKNADLDEHDGSNNPITAPPEISILVKEAAGCQHQLESLCSSAKSDQNAAVLFHLNTLFLQNVACLLAIQSDPAAAHVNIRKHPIIARIASIRSLITQARQAMSASITKQPKPPSLLKAKNKNRESENLAARQPNKLHFDVNGNLAQGNGNTSISEGSIEKKEHMASSTLRKEKLKRKRSTLNSDGKLIAEEDDEKANALVCTILDNDVTNGIADAEREQKRRKLNRLIFEMERDRHNKLARRSVSGDADAARDSRRMQSSVASSAVGSSIENENGDDMFDDDKVEGESELRNGDEGRETEFAAKEKKKARKTRNKEGSKPHVYTFNDAIDPDSKRKASKNIVANRGLTRYRPRIKKTPRTKNRLAYENAIKKSHSVTRKFEGYPGLNYSGESTGINMAARKSSNLSLF